MLMLMEQVEKKKGERGRVTFPSNVLYGEKYGEWRSRSLSWIFYISSQKVQKTEMREKEEEDDVGESKFW